MPMRRLANGFLATALLCAGSLARATPAEDAAEWDRLNEAARPMYESGDFAQATVASRRVLDFALAHTETLGPDRVAVSWHNFGQVNFMAGKLAEARDAYEHALPLLEAVAGARSPQVAVVLNSLAGLEHRESKYASAEKYARRALDIARAEQPPGEQVAEYSNTLGWILFDTQRYAEAAELYATALGVLSAKADANDPRLVMLRKQLAAAKAGVPNIGGALAMSTAADAHEAFIAKIAALARERKEAELLDCFDAATRAKQEAAIRDYLDKTGYKFFAGSSNVASYEHVTGASTADGRQGLWHYGFVEDKKHRLQPFQLAIIDSSAGPKLLYLDTGSCVPGRHPRVGPCK